VLSQWLCAQEVWLAAVEASAEDQISWYGERDRHAPGCQRKRRERFWRSRLPRAATLLQIPAARQPSSVRYPIRVERKL